MSPKDVLKKHTASRVVRGEISGLTHQVLPDSLPFTEVLECSLVMRNPEDRISEDSLGSPTMLENLITFPAQVIGGFNSVTKCLSHYIDLIKHSKPDFESSKFENASYLTGSHH